MANINLIVAGSGEGTYKNLYPATKDKNSDLKMKIALLIDVMPRQKLSPKIKEILEETGAQYLEINSPAIVPKETDIPFLENRAGIVMTPNRTHVPYARFFVSLGIPAYIEKPVACSAAGLKEFLDIDAERPSLLYGAEYCVDGKALGLLYAAGVLETDDPRRAYIKSSPDIKNLYKQLGQLLSIHGKMLEGEGPAGTLDHRPWAFDGTQGGMIRDLLSHLFGPLYDIGLTGQDVVDLKVKLGKYEHSMALGIYRPLNNAAEGETYAKIEGKFVMPYGTPSFLFEVGKYWPKHDRSLTLTFEHGCVKFSYEKPFEVVVEVGSARATSRVTADFYPTLAFIDFKRFLEGKRDGHIDRAAAIVKFNERARESGLKQAKLL